MDADNADIQALSNDFPSPKWTEQVFQPVGNKDMSPSGVHLRDDPEPVL